MAAKGIFVAGVRKCGTTLVFDLLAGHPLICPCKVKEPHFFALSDQVVGRHFEWYRNLFGCYRGEQRILDGSTSYFAFPGALGRIHERFGDAKFVVCLRDPAKRAYSAYWHMRSQYPIVERRQFLDILCSLRAGSAEGVADFEGWLIEKAAKDGAIREDYLGDDYLKRRLGAPFVSRFPDRFWFYRYVGESIYSRKVEEILVEGKDVHLVFLEALLANSRQEIERLLAFLGIEDKDGMVQLSAVANRNRTYVRSNSILGPLLSSRLGRGLRRRISDGLKLRIKSALLKPPTVMSKDERSILMDLLSQEYDYWFGRFPHLRAYWA